MAEEKKKKEQIKSEFTTKRKFWDEAEKIFTSLKSRNPFSLGVDVGHRRSLDVDVYWYISLPDVGKHCSPDHLEFVLRVLVCYQTSNVVETQLNLYGNCLYDIPAKMWKLFSKFNNVTYLNLGDNRMKVISTSICDFVHLQYLNLSWSELSEEGVVGVCELLKVCCPIVCWSVVLDILSG